MERRACVSRFSANQPLCDMKRVVITGSTRGLGFGLARRFLAKGCRVVINGTTASGVQRALAALHEFSGSVHGVVADVATEPGVERLFGEAEAQLGPVDIWVNNAGLGQPVCPAWEVGAELAERITAVNILGVVHGTVVPFRAMRQRGGGMIFTMEGHGSDGRLVDGMALYGMSKSAATYFTRAIAREAAGSGVAIGRLLPGIVVTDLLLETLAGDDPQNASRRKFYNLLADDVATVSAFLVDGMLSARGPSPSIRWLTPRKVMFRMLFGRFLHRQPFRGELQ